MSNNSGGKGKSKLITYLLWMLGGIFGLHHFYLGRDLQGFLWWCSLGGYFGVGWARDAFHISEYVDDANEDKEYMKRLKDAVKRDKKPPFSTSRFTGMVMMAYLLSIVYSIAIPEEEVAGIDWNFLHVFVPLACALGVWAVGNVGHQQGGLLTPVITAYASLIFKYITDESTASTLMVLASALAFDTFEKKWRPKDKTGKSFLKRILVIGGCCLLYASLWGSYFYFNATVEDGNGEEIPIREAVYHFFKSPWWLDLKQSLVALWDFAKEHGWWEVWKQIVELSDPSGEQYAFKVLNLSAGASQSEINSQCRQLAVKYHPDKMKDHEDKSKAQETFYEVQQACELLSKSRAKRRKRNRTYDDKS